MMYTIQMVGSRESHQSWTVGVRLKQTLTPDYQTNKLVELCVTQKPHSQSKLAPLSSLSDRLQFSFFNSGVDADLNLSPYLLDSVTCLENKMSTKVDLAVEPRRGQTTGTTTSTAASSSSPKISMFGAKSGFVIPRNKLSGSLVPIFRGGKKQGGSDVANEESTKQVQRKTKWGSDLTQDAAVRKGRALAYQTRMDQITQQLKLGILEIGDNQDSPLAAQYPDQESYNHQINSEKSELLELERREAIGEILKLDPSYKAPPDYKPLLKEARVPIPVKEYPGYNFLGLIFGPGSDTQKRLEKETGAKIQVYGTKADTGEKGEITSLDEKEIHGAYEELYILVSAETYEKVDAAVALIELLVTPVSGKPVAVSTTSTSVSGDDVNVLSQSQDTATPPYIVPTAMINQGVGQPVIGGPTQASPQGQFRYPGPWFPVGHPHTSMRPPFGFIPPPNPSAPILNNPAHLLSSPYNPSNMPSLFGPRPAPAAGYGPILQNPSLLPRSPQQTMQVLQRPYMTQARPLGYTGQPRNSPMSAPQPLSAQPNISAPLSFTGTQPAPMGPPPIARPLTPAGSSTGWPGAPAGTPASLGLNNMAQMAPPIITPQGPRPVVTQPIVASSAPVFSSVPPSQVRPSPASSAYVPIPAPARAPIHSSSIAPMQPATPIPSPVASTSPSPPMQLGSSVTGSIPSFTPIKPPSVTAPKPQHPSSGDFTFQPHRPQNPASQVVPRPSSQPTTQNALPPNLMVQPPLAPQAPSFRLAVHNSIPQPVMKAFPRPQVSNQMGQPQAHISAAPFTGNPTASASLPRLPAIPNPSPVSPSTAGLQMRPRNFSPAHQMPNLAGPLPPRPGNPVQYQQNYPVQATRPENLLAPNQHFSNNLPFAPGKPASIPSGVQQIYDPFSPTSVPQQQGGNLAKVRKQENDPEYEDLMASVGVK